MDEGPVRSPREVVTPWWCRARAGSARSVMSGYAKFEHPHVKIRAGRPVEGCALRPQGVLRSSAGHEEGIELRWRWLRSRDVVANCASAGCSFAHDYDPVNRNRRGAALQCAICLKEQRAPETLTFCSARCFVDAWPSHKQCHAHPRTRHSSYDSAASGDAARRPAPRAFARPPCLHSSAPGPGS